MTLAFAGYPLDRADPVRADSARLAALAGPDARLLLLDRLIPRRGESDGLQWGRVAEAGEGAELVFLGLLEGEACFAAVPEGGDTDPAYARRETWAALARLADPELALYGGARSVLDWHARHRFCAQCGRPTSLTKGGWQRDCSGCGTSHFPRVDPVAIMLVEHEGRLLLGRNAGFPPGTYSALAGFVEPGETIEEAVAREVREEAGVRAREVRYVASQPWPFPSQLMIGCHAMADSDALAIDPNELEDARWFARAEIAEAIEKGDASTGLKAPTSRAIAHFLLRWWLEETP
jgi:NAD+ diphosphatase